MKTVTLQLYPFEYCFLATKTRALFDRKTCSDKSPSHRSGNGICGAGPTGLCFFSNGPKNRETSRFPAFDITGMPRRCPQSSRAWAAKSGAAPNYSDIQSKTFSKSFTGSVKTFLPMG